jgi:hypothetical protein
MSWRTAIGLKPTSTDLGLDLIKAAERHGLTGWQHDAGNDSIRNGDHVINLANIHLEYAAAILRRPGRSGVVPSPGTGESGVRARLAFRTLGENAIESVATSMWQACTNVKTPDCICANS